MASTTPAKDLVRIKPDGGNIVLHPENDDLFVRTGKQVITACQLGISLELWLNETRGMMEKLAEWSEAHAGQVRECYFAFRGSRIAIFFVPNSGQFDFDLADQLADLNTDLVKNFNVGMVEVQQIPLGELDRFVNRDSARRVYGEEQGTPLTVGA